MALGGRETMRPHVKVDAMARPGSCIHEVEVMRDYRNFATEEFDHWVANRD